MDLCVCVCAPLPSFINVQENINIRLRIGKGTGQKCLAWNEEWKEPSRKWDKRGSKNCARKLKLIVISSQILAIRLASETKIIENRIKVSPQTKKRNEKFRNILLSSCRWSDIFKLLRTEKLERVTKVGERQEINEIIKQLSCRYSNGETIYPKVFT